MPHLQADIEHLVKREEHRDLERHGQAAGQRVGAGALVERHRLLVQPHLVVGELLAQLQDFRLHRLHPVHAHHGTGLQREERPAHEHGEQQDRHAEIAGQMIEGIEHQEDRLGEEPEPAPIDGIVEMRQPQLVAVVVQQLDFLRPAEPGADRCRLVGRCHGGQPVLVAEAEPAATHGLLGGSHHVLVIYIFFHAVEGADAAFEGSRPPAGRRGLGNAGVCRRRHHFNDEEKPG